MYDKVKCRHETPTPEKQPRDSNNEGDGDDEDNDGNESDEEEEEEDDHQENKYLLRERKPVVNRYMAPPMRKTGGEVLTNSCCYSDMQI